MERTANSAEGADNAHNAKDVVLRRLTSSDMDPLFAAVTQATEEAVDNALIAAKTMIGPILGRAGATA